MRQVLKKVSSHLAIQKGGKMSVGQMTQNLEKCVILPTEENLFAKCCIGKMICPQPVSGHIMVSDNSCIMVNSASPDRILQEYWFFFFSIITPFLDLFNMIMFNVFWLARRQLCFYYLLMHRWSLTEWKIHLASKSVQKQLTFRKWTVKSYQNEESKP
jgi:hypothetical protein